METEEQKRVCVTGAGGFVASWVVKLFLAEGYVVHGTVRGHPGEDKKYDHLNKLDRASNSLRLFHADLLDYESLRSAIEGCVGVLHVACPVPSTAVTNPEEELLEPAVKGTLNVLRACLEAKVKRVVYVSSVAAVVMNPEWPKDKDMDETCWSDKEYCRATKNWYFLSKTEAESLAFEYAKQNGLDVVSVCPGVTFGPVLQPTLNTSTAILLKCVKDANFVLGQVTGDGDSVPDRLWMLGDVRDVADAVRLAYEKHEAEGRYICITGNLRTRDLVKKLGSICPGVTFPKKFHEAPHENRVTSERLQKLGWAYRPLEETLRDSVESYRKAGFLPS